MIISAPTPPADDLIWLALVIWDEARGEACLGQAAVGQVVLNRTARKYASDGSIRDTILWKFQFSGFWFAMEDKHYTQISKDLAQAEAEAGRLLLQAKADRAWAGCLAVANALQDKTYTSSAPQWGALQVYPDTVLYYNPAICRTPTWAAPENRVCTIGHHTFFRA